MASNPRQSGPYRASGRKRPLVYHTEPECPMGERIPNPQTYTGNELHEMGECSFCRRLREGRDARND